VTPTQDSIVVPAGPLRLPSDSSLRVGLDPGGILAVGAAIVASNNRPWVIREDEKGRVFLRAALTAVDNLPSWMRPESPLTAQPNPWRGTIQAPLVRVDWR
jgi:hypothetical protein